MSEPSRFPHWHPSAALLAALLLLQAPLWLNPGYFAHDELQWAARADTATLGALPFVSFTDVAWFQYRPLTFNLWLLLSHALFETPRLFHAVFVLLGSLNAVLLANALRHAGCRAPVAFCTALVFGLSPFAVWVQGWVGCLGDLLWVGFGLGIVAVLQHLDALPPAGRGEGWNEGASTAGANVSSNPGEKLRSPRPFPPPVGERAYSWLIAAIAAAFATALALLSKEAALSIPALLGLGAVFLHLRRTWLAATLASGIVAIVYLGLRLDTLTTQGDASAYALHAAALPSRWLEYMVFPWALGTEEIHVLRMAAWSKWLTLAIAPLALVTCLWRAWSGLGLAWLAGGMLALAPVLALPASFNQYGYGFAALGCGVAGLAWTRLGPPGRSTLALLAALAVAHGFQIQMRMLEVGRLQAVFSPSLAELAQTQPKGLITLWPECTSHYPVYVRLIQDVPAWRGVPLGARVGMAESAEQATHLIAADGRVQPRGAAP